MTKDQVTLWVGATKSKSPSYKFGDHRHYGIGDIMVLVCHVISHEHVIKGKCVARGSSPSR